MRWCEDFQLLALGCFAGLGIGRATILYARRVHVLVIDWRRSAWERLADLIAILLFAVWMYEAVAYAWPLRPHVGPALLRNVIVEAAVVRAMGVAIETAGVLLFALALWGFADSWRIGIDRHAAGSLVTTGIFAWTRNPIYIALDLLIFGTFLVLGRAIFLVLAIGLAPLLHYQIRREERHLKVAYGQPYTEYCVRVGRYV